MDPKDLKLNFFKPGEKTAPQMVLAKLRDGTVEEQQAHAVSLLRDAQESGLSLSALLDRHVDPCHKDAGGQFNGLQLSGHQAIFALNGTPLNKSSEEASARLSATGDMFTTGGMKVLLPLLIDNLTREVQSAPLLERVEDLVANTRQTAGNEMITEIILDKDTDDSYSSFRISEGGKIPVRKLKATNMGVKFYKIGSGIEMTYEVARRVGPQAMILMANRQAFERTQTEARLAVQTLLEGDSVHPAAPVVALQTIDGKATGKLRDRAEGFLKWLMAAAKAGRPIDTLVVSHSTWFELTALFPIQNTANVPSVGLGVGNTFGANFTVANGMSMGFTIVLSSEMEENRILGYRKPETMERLIETGSQISESETAIRNQSVLVTNTINSGYAIHYHQSREVLTWTN
mgnify:FL=1